MRFRGTILTAVIVVIAVPATGADITIKVSAISDAGVGKVIGTIRAVDGQQGLRLVPRLSGLAPGSHGFHVHQNPNCGNKGSGGRVGAGLAAGGHFDPANTGHHGGPKGHGHHGDLPALVADKNGVVRKSVTVPRLKVADLWGRSIVIHAGGDSYADQPSRLGGSGARVACARIVKAKARAGE